MGVALVFDEMMTSRMSAGREQRLGVIPDLTTLGKCIGGGMSFGAFPHARMFLAAVEKVLNPLAPLPAG